MFLSVLLSARGGSPMGSWARQVGHRRLSAGAATASAAYRQRLRGGRGGAGQGVSPMRADAELRLSTSSRTRQAESTARQPRTDLQAECPHGRVAGRVARSKQITQVSSSRMRASRSSGRLGQLQGGGGGWSSVVGAAAAAAAAAAVALDSNWRCPSLTRACCRRRARAWWRPRRHWRRNSRRPLCAEAVVGRGWASACAHRGPLEAQQSQIGQEWGAGAGPCGAACCAVPAHARPRGFWMRPWLCYRSFGEPHDTATWCLHNIPPTKAAAQPAWDPCRRGLLRACCQPPAAQYVTFLGRLWICRQCRCAGAQVGQDAASAPVHPHSCCAPRRLGPA